MSAPDVQDLAMVAVYPEPDEASAITAEESDTLHVTMIFLGEASEIDMKAAARAVGSASGSTAPMTGKLGGVGVFAKGDDGYPQIALPSVPGLAALHALLVKQLADEGITSSSEHDWVPHMTLAYVDEPELPDMATIGKAVTFNQISLVVADVRKDFPLDPGGSADDHQDGRSHSVKLTRAEMRRHAILLSKAKELLT